MKKRYLYILPAIALGLTACEPSFENEIDGNTYYSGDADFSVYVSVGNSLTAGFMDGTVFKSGQQYSFPNILAEQFKIVGGGEFTQPFFGDDEKNIGGLLLGGNPVGATRMIVNMYPGADGQPLGPQNIKGTPSIEISSLQQKAYNNMGIPGAKVFHLLVPGYGDLAGVASGTANPYFVRHATKSSATVLEDALSLNPTFFTNWIGANDVLSYATSGGTGVDQTGNSNAATYGANDITDPMLFAGTYKLIVDGLTRNGAKGVVATIPDVTSIPFFTTVPYNPLSPALLGGDENIDQLNQFIGMFKQLLGAGGQGDRLQLLSKDKPNPLLIKDEALADLGPLIEGALMANMGLDAPTAKMVGMVFGQARHATSNDLILLTTKAVIGTQAFEPTGGFADALNLNGITYPLADQHVLTVDEQKTAKAATLAFNNIIRSVASEKNLAVADMNDIMNKAVVGLRVEDGQIYTADYFSGLGNLNKVMFSLDGVHPNARGYAFIAAEILRVINKHYNAKIPLVNPAVYPGPTLLQSN